MRRLTCRENSCYGYAKSSFPLHPVTTMKTQTGPHAISLPILIPCFKKVEQEGEAISSTYPRWDAALLRLSSAAPVRRFNDADFSLALKDMRVGQARRFVALRLLLTAIARKQEEDIKSARERLCVAVASDCKSIEGSFRVEGKGKQRKKLTNYQEGSLMGILARVLKPCDLADEAKIMTERYLTEDPVRLFGAETSGAMKGVQLVLWRSGTRLMPAVYCEDRVAAAYTTAFFGRGWKVCPYSACGEWFIPTRDRQDHCCPKHREAHRVARWRMRQKASNAKSEPV